MITNENPSVSSEENSQQEKEQEEYHLTPIKRLIYWLYLLLLLAFVVSISVLLSVCWAPIQEFQQSDNYFYANQVGYLWKQGYITDIKVLPSSQSCPESYEQAFSY